ncbi:hypothetical protein Sango_1496400 [Sesamum angolense]|uniref:Uncharacterized protein n=1 Tax=Sesamum angolense TaxID=2727404 RepID=A0AAE1WNX8_9LAMI|nr:hypothetical protein Sango_1496400 [Sesamum angolense]
MADDFGAENLEDGDLWLPSDFFSMDEVQVSNPYSSNLSCMQNSHPFSSSTFLHPQTHNPCLSKPLPSLQRFKPAVRYGASGGAGGGTHDPWVVGNFFGERAWALQRQQHNHRFGQNPVFPGVRMGAHGGTGVFLPRISSDMLAAPVTKNHNHHCFGKGQRLTKSHELQLPPRKILLNRRQEEHRGYFAAEVHLSPSLLSSTKKPANNHNQRERKISHHMGFPSGPLPDDPKQKLVMGYPSIDRYHPSQQMYPQDPPAYPGPSHPPPQPPPNPAHVPSSPSSLPWPSHPPAYTSSSTQTHSHHPYASSSFQRPPEYDPSQFQQDSKYPIPSGYEPSQFQHDTRYPVSSGYDRSQFQHDAKYMIPSGYDPSQFEHNVKYPISSGYDPSQFQHNAQYPIPSAYGPPQFQHDPKNPFPLGYDPSQFPHDPKLPIPGPQNPYSQPYNNYYYQQPYKPLVPENGDDSSFGRVMLILMIILVGGMCMMSLAMWFLFGTNIPEFGVTSLKVSNFTVTDTNLTGEWNVDFSVHNTNRELAIHFDMITSSIFYKETLLGVSSLQPFQD